MTYLVIPKHKARKLCQAASNIQSLLDDGTLGAAFTNGDDKAVDRSVTALDELKDAAVDFAGEFRHTSPFLRYRREILGDYETAVRLRAMVMNLWGGRPANLSLLFHHADEQHTRIALECIASFTQYGENDTFFMTLASEIDELPKLHEVMA